MKDDLVLLTKLYPPEDAFLTELLQSAGITVFKRWEGIAPVEGLTVGPLAEVALYVSREEEEDARQLLQSIQGRSKK